MDKHIEIVMWMFGVLVAMLLSLIGVVYANIISRLNSHSKRLDANEEGQHELETNYNAKFATVNSGIADLKLSISQDMSQMKHGINNSLHKMFAVMDELKTMIDDKYIPRDLCESYHEQLEIKMKNIEEKITKQKG